MSPRWVLRLAAGLKPEHEANRCAVARRAGINDVAEREGQLRGMRHGIQQLADAKSSRWAMLCVAPRRALPPTLKADNRSS